MIHPLSKNCEDIITAAGFIAPEARPLTLIKSEICFQKEFNGYIGCPFKILLEAMVIALKEVELTALI